MYLYRRTLFLFISLLLTGCAQEVTISYFCMENKGFGSAGLVIGDSKASFEYEDFKFESRDGIYRSYVTKDGAAIEFNQATAQLKFFPSSDKEKMKFYNCHLQNIKN
jgi:hypothetical protein